MYPVQINWADDNVEKLGERRRREKGEQQKSNAGLSFRVNLSAPSFTGTNEDGPSFPPAWNQSSSHLSSNESKFPDRASGTSITVPSRAYTPSRPSLHTPTSPQTSIVTHDQFRYGSPLSLSLRRKPNLEIDASRRPGSSSRPGTADSHSTFVTYRQPDGGLVEEITELQPLSRRSFVSRTTTRSFEHLPQADLNSTNLARAEYKAEIVSRPVKSRFLERLEEDQPMVSLPNWLPPTGWLANGASRQGSPQGPKGQQPASLYSTVSSNVLSKWFRKQSPTPVEEDPPTPESNTDEIIKQYRALLEKTASAPLGSVLHCLKKPSNELGSPDAAVNRNIKKRLWMVNFLRSPMMDSFLIPTQVESAPFPRVPPATADGAVLCYFSDIADSLFMSVVHPRRHILHLSESRTPESLPVPSNMSSLIVKEAAALMPLPLATACCDYVIAPTICADLAAFHIPIILDEIWRVCDYGGVLELRIIEPLPVRMGPLVNVWIKKHLVCNIRCSTRTVTAAQFLVKWVGAAKFTFPVQPAGTLARKMHLPIVQTVDNVGEDCNGQEPVTTEAEEVQELGMRVGRALWRATWGKYVEVEEDEVLWFWEDPQLAKECLAYGTSFETGTLFGVKQ